MPPPLVSASRRFVLIFFLAAAAAAVTLAFPSASVWFVTLVFLHTGLGLLLILLGLDLWRRWRKAPRHQPAGGRLTLLSAAIGLAALTGVILLIAGESLQHPWAKWLHIGGSALALLLVAVWLAGRLNGRARWGVAAAGAGLLLLPPAAWLARRYHPNPADVIRNPRRGFTSMAQEDGGIGPFFPSAAHTIDGSRRRDPYLPARFFENSAECGRCHVQIYREWRASMHHHSSFNNQFYRAAIVYMQQIDSFGARTPEQATVPSRWCAACHDSAVIFTGKWNTPIVEQLHTPAAQAGLGCLSCHGIVHVKDTLGNNAFTVEDPPLHRLVESKNPFIRFAHDAALHLNPTPHDRTFLKPFMVNQPGEFCSVCHKVHLDVPVNHYRWIRGFDEYDNWQGSGVDWQGSRSFYYPPKPLTCINCHMPLTRSQDPAAVNGFIHNHRFAAANTAVPYVDHDAKQLQDVERFLKGAVHTDIFAIARERGTQTLAAANAASPTQFSAFAQGEESGGFGSAATVLQRAANFRVIAPLNETRPTLKPGQTVRVDVVERTMRLGHFFPGGTIDAFDVWVDFKALDGNGKPFFWSGKILPNGRIDPGAEFYRALLIDAHGHPINKRDVELARSVIYVHLIPPGAADVVHYRVPLPRGIKGPITFVAKLKYRKFMQSYTNFAYAGHFLCQGQAAPEAAVAHGLPGGLPALSGPAASPCFTKDFDDRKMLVGPVIRDVAGKIHGRIPNLPVVTISQDRVTLPVGAKLAATAPAGASHADALRWNDYGIGLLLQGDLTGADTAFTQVTRIDPGYANGWLNVARVLVREGEINAAAPLVAHALQLDPTIGAAYFFRALVEKAQGHYNRALADLHTAAARYPRDRVLWDNIGRLYFLQGDYRQAVAALEKVIRIDPENVQAHYNLMLAYRGLDDRADSAREERLYERFKLNENNNALAGPYLRTHPDDNNERQPVHEHDSMLLTRAGQWVPVHPEELATQ